MERSDVFYEISNIVTKADFAEPKNGELFVLIQDQVYLGRPTSPSMLLHDEGQDADIGGVLTSVYLTTLLREAPPGGAITAKHLATTIRDLAERRRLIVNAQRHIDEWYSAPATTTAYEIEARYHASTTDILTSTTQIGVQSIGEVTDEVLTRISKAASAGKEIGMTMPLKGLRDLTGPLIGGNLVTIAGGSGHGKSAIAQQIAEWIAEKYGCVLFVSAEMSADEVSYRALATQTGISTEAMVMSRIDADQFQSLDKAYQDRLRDLNMQIDRTSAPSVSSIRGKAMRLKRMKGLVAVVVDHLIYMDRDQKMSEVEGVRRNLQGLKKIAKDLDVTMIVLAQLKGAYRDGPVREPNEGDIYLGATVEQESDLLLLVYREEYMLRRREPKHPDKGGDEREHQEWRGKLEHCAGLAKFILGKRRLGKGYGSSIVGFDGARNRMTDDLPTLYQRTQSEDRLPF